MTTEERSNEERAEAAANVAEMFRAERDEFRARLAAVERERDELRDLVSVLNDDADQALIDRDEAIEAESQVGDRIAAERDEAKDELAEARALFSAIHEVDLARESAALARIAAVEASEAELRAEVARYATALASMRFSKYRNAEDWAWLNAEGIGRRLAVLAASPTPTGPEPEPAESDGDVLRRMGTDAALWAAEFVRHAPIAAENGGVPLIEVLTDPGPGSWLYGWFCNAIETGRSAGRRGPATPTEPTEETP